jgi:mycothiol synthase
VELLDAQTAHAALTALTALEQEDAVPRIDAAEIRRLELLASGEPPEDDHQPGQWWAHVASTEGGRWYVGVRRSRERWTAEIGRLEHTSSDIAAVLADITHVTRASQLDGEPSPPLSVWLRAAEPSDIDACVADGWIVRRELGVFARPSTAEVQPRPAAEARPSAHASADGFTVRAFDPGLDVDAIVRVLSAAHAGQTDPAASSADDRTGGGWTRERFLDASRGSLHHPADLRVATDAEGRLVGVHWTKRRSVTVGEVHNLAIDPAVQGQGLGRRLLQDGLRHLAALRMREVLLWVDLTNDPAVALYRSEGFLPRARDVSLVRAP